MVPPLERLERREEPEAQGGEFVEADDCKAYEANKPDEGACLGRKCNVRRIRTLISPVYIGKTAPPLERVERREVTK